MYAAILFIILALVKYARGMEDWLEQAIEWTVPSAVGYFLGSCQTYFDEN
jgi:hypothetical protein